MNLECQEAAVGLLSHTRASTWRAQITLAKAAHYPHIVRFPNLASQHGDPDHP